MLQHIANFLKYFSKCLKASAERLTFIGRLPKDSVCDVDWVAAAKRCVEMTQFNRLDVTGRCHNEQSLVYFCALACEFRSWKRLPIVLHFMVFPKRERFLVACITSVMFIAINWWYKLRLNDDQIRIIVVSRMSLFVHSRSQEFHIEKQSTNLFPSERFILKQLWFLKTMLLNILTVTCVKERKENMKNQWDEVYQYLIDRL